VEIPEDSLRIFDQPSKYYLLTPCPSTPGAETFLNPAGSTRFTRPLDRRSTQARQSGPPDRLYPSYIGSGSATYRYYKLGSIVRHIYSANSAGYTL
jgi:hypothetical protein